MSDKQYEFQYIHSTADVLTIIAHRISKAVEIKYSSKAFDKLGHTGLLNK